jgi:hypothetical protein
MNGIPWERLLKKNENICRFLVSKQQFSLIVKINNSQLIRNSKFHEPSMVLSKKISYQPVRIWRTNEKKIYPRSYPQMFSSPITVVIRRIFYRRSHLFL